MFPTTTTMFSDEDARELFRLFPPQKSDDFSPKLILSSGGHGFVTLAFVQAQFRSRVTSGTHRLPIQSLADELDVDRDLVLKLVRNHPRLALLSADNTSIITADETDEIGGTLGRELEEGLLKISSFASQYDLDATSVHNLLKGLNEPAMDFGDQICGTGYQSRLVTAIKNLLEQGLERAQSVEFVLGTLPGLPPAQLVLRILRDLLSSESKYSEFDLQESPEIWCILRYEIQYRRDAIVQDLQSNAEPFIDLERICGRVPQIFTNLEEAKQYVEREPDINIFSKFAVSVAWVAKTAKDAARILQDGGRYSTDKAFEDIPLDLQDYLMQQVEAEMLKQSTERTLRVGDCFLTAEAYEQEKQALMTYGSNQALLQWQQLTDSPDKDPKFDMNQILELVSHEDTLQHDLLKDKVLTKAIEEKFSSTITSQEDHNEARFAEFWMERAITKCQVYSISLDAVEDQKLRDQLSELLATHARKDLLTETITKARSQGLVLSRRTRKNLGKFETIIKTETLDVPGIIAALHRFNKKQGIMPPEDSKLEEVKKTVTDDMIRRMQRQKPSDGPVLFLLLVLILFAKQYNSVLYATGKFAPKLLKQLKMSLPTEKYEQIEKWKEAAKNLSLTDEDRAEMKNMAEA